PLAPACVEAGGARARTWSGRGTPRDRCRAATRLPGSARPAWFGALALALLGAAGCTPYVEGNGVYHEEDRTPAETFTGVRIQDGIEATVTSGAAQQKVVVSGDANIVKDYVKTEIVSDQGSGPVLHVRVASGGGTVDPSLPLRVRVELAELRYVHAGGDSHVKATGVATLLLKTEARGKSSVLVMGAGGGRIEVVASDSSVDAASYPVAEGALVDLSSGARAELHSAGAVAGTVRGGCTLENFGDGLCHGVVVPVGETATILCPVP
ncbi:MAG TPA: DUF2807 domain-containing protein, partial [Anaeromyxobacter sp.]|nr:DUF2807 domain-containing protein [Anaeromyxobacter sp.]